MDESTAWYLTSNYNFMYSREERIPAKLVPTFEPYHCISCKSAIKPNAMTVMSCVPGGGIMCIRCSGGGPGFVKGSPW